MVLDQPDAVERFRRLAREARVAGQLYSLCGLLLVARPEDVGLAHSLSVKEATLIVRQGGFTFETPLVRGIVLVFANELPEHFRDRRDDAYQ